MTMTVLVDHETVKNSKQKMGRIRNKSLENVPATNNQLGLYHFQEVNLGQKIICFVLINQMSA